MNISRLPQLINQSHKNKSSYAVLHQKKTAPFLANVNIQRPSNYYAITICKILYVTMHNVIKYTGFVFRTYLLTYARNKKKVCKWRIQWRCIRTVRRPSCFQIVARLHGSCANVISFTAIKTVQPSSCQMLGNSQML